MLRSQVVYVTMLALTVAMDMPQIPSSPSVFRRGLHISVKDEGFFDGTIGSQRLNWRRIGVRRNLQTGQNQVPFRRMLHRQSCKHACKNIDRMLARVLREIKAVNGAWKLIWRIPRTWLNGSHQISSTKKHRERESQDGHGGEYHHYLVRCNFLLCPVLKINFIFS